MKILKLKHGDMLYDDEDEELVQKYKWHSTKGKTNNTYYAICSYYNNKRTTSLRFHRELLKTLVDGKKIIDHIDCNGLNNQKSNLRICTTSQNAMNRKKQKNNTSGYKGVCWKKSRKKWVAQIGIFIDGKYKRLNLGYFDDPKIAHESYCEASKEIHKEFGRVE